MSEIQPSAPPSVRLAMPAEAAAIAHIQRRIWLAADDAVSKLMLDRVSAEDMTQVWHAAITRPPLAPCRVLVAVEDDTVVGFATTMPSEDPDADESSDGMVSEFLIDASARGRGHGSRLLNAAVDTLRADGFSRATWWVRSTDDQLRLFLTEAGWAADGSHREIGTDDAQVRVKQVRLHTSIGDPVEHPAGPDGHPTGPDQHLTGEA